MVVAKKDCRALLAMTSWMRWNGNADLCKPYRCVCKRISYVCKESASVCKRSASVCKGSTSVCKRSSGVCKESSGVCKGSTSVCKGSAGVCKRSAGLLETKNNENAPKGLLLFGAFSYFFFNLSLKTFSNFSSLG